MVLPNSLGVFTVVGLAFYLSYSPDKLYFRSLVVVTAITLFASGSGTGILVLFALLSMLILNKITGLRKWVMGITLFALSAALLANLPALIHRPDVSESVFSSPGRVGKLIEVVSESSAIEILIGHGIGFGTNTATNLISSDVTGGSFSADSTVTVLLTQLGITGVILFYGILFWAYRRDPQARPAYLVFAITSLTINITEVFPVNFLLGLALAGTSSLKGRAPRNALHDQQIPEQVMLPPSAVSAYWREGGGSRGDCGERGHRKI
jgi:hypothetical protein